MFDEEYYKNLYQEKTNDELLDLYWRAGLTDEARNALTKVFADRGINPHQPPQEKLMPCKNNPQALNGNYTLNLIFSNSRIGRLQHLGLFSFYIFIICISISIMTQVNYFLCALLVIPGLVLPMIATVVIKVRRLHDFGFSGWSLLLGLLPVVGAFWVLVIFAWPGSPSSNQYGDPPIPSKKSDFWRIMSMPIIFLGGFFTHLLIG